MNAVAVLAHVILLSWTADAEQFLRYQVCGDLSTQLASHVAAISRAVRKNKSVAIPNVFIVDEKADSRISLSSVFDTQAILESVWALGIDAQLVSPSPEHATGCFELTELEPEDTETAAVILDSFRNSKKLQGLLDKIRSKVNERGLDHSEGVCLHHLSSPQWKEHCQNWSAVDDELYRGNCDIGAEQTLLQSLESRSLARPDRWIYYVGDGSIPQELTDSGRTVVTQFDNTDEQTLQDVLSSFSVLTDANTSSGNFWALVDFFVCRSLPHFVGNSVHFWSAFQIALHHLEPTNGGSTYWYNSQNIPLADFFPIYHIPIVYTYTELSAGAGKFMLKASISSVKKHMPRSKIHVMYHGSGDVVFRSWLVRKGAIIHEHEPEWRSSIEEMRLKGDPMRSYLFLHEGNYFGTWQRIDIPKFIDSEYCLLLAADTVIVKPFTMSDFGMDITKELAFSAEDDPYLILPWNSGISLMNVPYLRETHSDFMDFIMKHVDGSPYDPDVPSDQGAYLDFYKGHVDFLSIDFNFKPYFQVKLLEAASAKVLHFHGPKPHHYIGHFLGLPCDAASQSLCDQAGASPTLCSNVVQFASNLLHSGDTSAKEYCQAAYAGDNAQIEFCTFIFHRLGNEDGQCTSLAQEIDDAKAELAVANLPAEKKYVDPGVGEYKYNVCNGLSNQLVYHAIAITKAIKQKRPVAIFDSFIYNGEQTTDENELPTVQNSISFGSVFDFEYLQGKIADLGIESRLIASDWDLPKTERVPCVEMTPLSGEDARIAMDLVRAFKPTGVLRELIANAKVTMKRRGLDMSNGVCVHHRDGQDWHDHCSRWSAIPDGTYRGNCWSETKLSFLESLESRALSSTSRWVYYVGDHAVPAELTESKYSVVTKDSFLDTEAKRALMNELFPAEQKPPGPFHDVWSLVDFMMCESLNYFVGNSASSWSAVQLAVRQSSNRIREAGSYWYNSQSIPLAGFLPLYQIPLAFTYTELSLPDTKYLLRASITSAKLQMPSSRITVLYHGDDDRDLKAWLRREGVIIQQHYPTWRAELVQKGLRSSASAFFQKWQRIDLPRHVESEYCMFLEPGTIIEQPFTMADLGLNLTWSLAFVTDKELSTDVDTSGISLMNIPQLKRTYSNFFEFVRNRLDTTSPVHDFNIRTAYSSFYSDTVQTLPIDFAFQPHEPIPRHKAALYQVVHFNDVKPDQYIGHVLGVEYGNATDALISRALDNSYLCSSIQAFSRQFSGHHHVSDYCRAGFSSNRKNQDICTSILKSIGSQDERCEDFRSMAREAMAPGRRRHVSDSAGSSQMMDGSTAAGYSYAAGAFGICAMLGITAMLIASPKMIRSSTSAGGGRPDPHMNLWTSMNVLLTVALAHVIANVVMFHTRGDGCR